MTTAPTLKELILLELYPMKKVPVKHLIVEISKKRAVVVDAKNLYTMLSERLGELEEAQLVSSDRIGKDKREVYYFLTEEGRHEAIRVQVAFKMNEPDFWAKFNKWGEKEVVIFFKQWGIDLAKKKEGEKK